MRNGRDATRRNRNIGTEKQGHGKDNEMVIPTCGSIANEYWEKLVSFKDVIKKIGDIEITFLVEKTRKDTCHACTIDDICLVLKHVPKKDLDEIKLIILRQPKHKEEMLMNVWGRIAYYADVGKYRGRAIILETCNYKNYMFWPNSLTPDEADELERIKQDGHQIIRSKRGHNIKPNLETVRSTQLYRTLLHEIGHNIDFNTDDNYFNKTSKDREVFAHSYADKMRKALIEQGVIPFNRLE